MAWTGLSADARVALAGDRTVTSRVTAYTPLGGVAPNLPVADWSVTYDATSDTRAKGSLRFADPTLWSANPFDALSPFGAEVDIERGLVLIDDWGKRRVEYIPMGRFVVVSAADEVPVARGGVTLDLEDRSRWLAEKKLDTAEKSNTGARVVAEIERLMRDCPRLAYVEFIDESGSDTLCPNIDYQRDRRGAVMKLAAAIGCEFFFDRLGRARLRPVPTLDDPPAWRIEAGRNLIRATRKATREGAYSRVFAVQVLPQSTGVDVETVPPLTASAVDDDELSPTYYYGAFGDVTRKWASALFTTQNQIDAAARTYLEKLRGFSYALEVEQLPNEAMDCGDVVTITPNRSGTRIKQIIDGFTVAGKPSSSPQVLNARGQELPPEEETAA